MEQGDIAKYMPTSTVGKVVGSRNVDGRVWLKLDNTGLWYDESALSPCDPAEYKTVSFKYRETKVKSSDDLVADLRKEDADISEFTIVG